MKKIIGGKKQNLNTVKRILTFMLVLLIVLEPILTLKIYGLEPDITKIMNVTIGEGNLDESALQKTIEIPKLKDILNVRVNTGNVNYTRDGNNVTLNVSNGSPVRSVLNSKKYSKNETLHDSNTIDSFASTVNYIDSFGYKGVIPKNGDSYVMSGELKTSDTKYVTGQNNKYYDSSFYAGMLDTYVYSGSYTPEQTTYITYKHGPQDIESFENTTYYDDGTYSGMVNKSGNSFMSGTTLRQLTDVKEFYANTFSSYALKNDNTVWAWGSNNNGQLGINNYTSYVTEAYKVDIENVKEVVQENYTAFFIKNDGTLWATGLSKAGRLGTAGIEPEANTYKPIYTGMDNVKKVVMDSVSFCTIVLKNDGTVWASGENTYGQLGLGDTVNRKIFTKVNITNVSNIQSYNGATFYVLSDGTLWASGRNNFGRLGVGDTIDRLSPTKINITGVRDLYVNTNNTFIIKTDNTVWSWGNNGAGQLGVGTSVNNTIPNKISILGVKNLVTIQQDTFALTNNYELWAWGSNSTGLLGLGDKVQRNTPVKINLPFVYSVQFSKNLYAYVITHDGGLYVWGSNDEGQLGLGDNVDRLSPVLTSISGINRLVNNVNTAIVIGGNRIWGTGSNFNGALGAGDTVNKNSFVEVIFGRLMKNVHITTYCSYVLFKDGTMVSTGKNTIGQLGIGTSGDVTTFTKVMERAPMYYQYYVGNVKKPAEDTRVWKYRGNVIKPAIYRTEERKIGPQLNNNKFADYIDYTGSDGYTGKLIKYGSYYEDTPTTVTNLTNVKKIYTGGSYNGGAYYYYAVKNDGTIWSWGGNVNGQLGLGDYANRNIAEKVDIDDVKELILGSDRVAIVKNDNTVWGINVDSNSKTNKFTKINVPDIKQIVLENTYGASYILKNDGTLWSAGRNNYGQLGVGNTYDNYKFTRVPIENVDRIFVNDANVHVVKRDGTVWGFGRNFTGTLGVSDEQIKTSPIKLNVTDIVKVIGNTFYSVMLKSDGTVWTMGSDGNGQLGRGFTDNSIIYDLGQVPITDVVDIQSNNQAVIALKSNGELWAWGGGVDGKLGNGILKNSTTPTKVNISNVKKYFLGYNGNAFAETMDGSVYVWGNNTYGKLGIGSSVHAPSPVLIGNGGLKLYSFEYDNTAIVNHDGTFRVSGRNYNGQLGVGDTVDRLSFNTVDIPNIKEIYSEDKKIHILKEDGTVLATGRNQAITTLGILGVGDDLDKNVFTNVLQKNRNYSQNYMGTVGLPEYDTRIWGQNYFGTVHKEGYDNYYKYEVTIEYIDNSAPTLSLILPLDNSKYSHEMGYNEIPIEINVNDIDTGDMLDVYYRIDGNEGDSGIQLRSDIVSTGVVQTVTDVINANYLTEGVHKISLWVVDSSGALSEEKSLNVVIDTTPPTGNLLINVPSRPWTYNHNAPLLITSSDLDIYQMRFRNELNIWSAWEDYNNIKDWILSNGDGLKTVKLQLMDDVGNISHETFNSIFIDSVTPVLELTLPNKWVNDELDITINAYDEGGAAGSGLSYVEYECDKTFPITFSSGLMDIGLTEIPYTLNLNEPGIYLVHAVAGDRAGRAIHRNRYAYINDSIEISDIKLSNVDLSKIITKLNIDGVETNVLKNTAFTNKFEFTINDLDGTDSIDILYKVTNISTGEVVYEEREKNIDMHDSGVMNKSMQLWYIDNNTFEVFEDGIYQIEITVTDNKLQNYVPGDDMDLLDGENDNDISISTAKVNVLIQRTIPDEPLITVMNDGSNKLINIDYPVPDRYLIYPQLIDLYKFEYKVGYPTYTDYIDKFKVYSDTSIIARTTDFAGNEAVSIKNITIDKGLDITDGYGGTIDNDDITGGIGGTDGNVLIEMNRRTINYFINIRRNSNDGINKDAFKFLNE